MTTFVRKVLAASLIALTIGAAAVAPASANEFGGGYGRGHYSPYHNDHGYHGGYRHYHGNYGYHGGYYRGRYGYHRGYGRGYGYRFGGLALDAPAFAG